MDEDLFKLASSLPLDQKVEKSILNFQAYEHEALKCDPEGGYYLCDSFGKDSGLILHLAKLSKVKFIAHHNLTTLDPPELILHGRKHHPGTVIHVPPVPMLRQMVESETQGPPTRLVRWCCELYKEKSDPTKVKVFGVRAAESARRKANWKVWQPDRRGKWILNPILYWTDEDVWEYTRREKIPYCSLYDEGFKRLGCIGCPMAGAGRYKEFARWPKYERAWKRAFERFWVKWHGVPRLRRRWISMHGKWELQPLPGEVLEERDGVPGFWTYRRWYDLRGFTKWEDLWAWWMEELDEPSEFDCQMGQF
jgi:phosphoadenosine phosphosulfate reductase